MRHAIIFARDQRIDRVDTDIHAAKRIAGLGEDVDHGHISRALSIIVDGSGLRKPNQAYFTIAGQLFAGNAVLYATDIAGETIDLDAWPPIAFMSSIAIVERNIELGLIQRPTISVNGKVVWAWNTGGAS